MAVQILLPHTSRVVFTALPHRPGDGNAVELFGHRYVWVLNSRGRLSLQRSKLDSRP